MDLQRTATGWTVLAPAKLNLYLEVLGRRDDGYHALEMLNVPVRLYDELHFSTSSPDSSQAKRFQLRLAGSSSALEGIPSGEENLVMRAVRRLAERAGCEQGATIVLRKRIPALAGLGGGSSDAAAALLAANAGWGLNWPLDRLSQVAAEIGSDVPFFLAGGAALCRGRGELVEPLELPAGVPVVIAQPAMGLSTPQVFSRVELETLPDPQESSQHLNRLVTALLRGDWRGIAHGLRNRLQAAAARISPEVDRLAAAFGRLPFVAHQLTGSGAAYFGLCRHIRQAQSLGAELASRQLGRIIVTRTCR